MAEKKETAPPPDLDTIAANLRDAGGGLSGVPPGAELVEDPESVPKDKIIGTVEWVVARQAERDIKITKADAEEALIRGYTVGTWAGVPNYECVLCPNVPVLIPGPNYGKMTPATASINLDWLLEVHIPGQHAEGMPLSAGEPAFLFDARGRLLRLGGR